MDRKGIAEWTILPGRDFSVEEGLRVQLNLSNKIEVTNLTINHQFVGTTMCSLSDAH